MGVMEALTLEDIIVSIIRAEERKADSTGVIPVSERVRVMATATG